MSRHKLLHCKIKVKRCSTRHVLPLFVAMTLAGCSVFGGDEPPTAEGDGEYPNLAEVPERPDVESFEEKAELEEGLRADRQNARYSEGPLATSTAAGIPPPPPATFTLDTTTTASTVTPSGTFTTTETDVAFVTPTATAPIPASSASVAAPSATVSAPVPVPTAPAPVPTVPTASAPVVPTAPVAPPAVPVTPVMAEPIDAPAAQVAAVPVNTPPPAPFGGPAIAPTAPASRYQAGAPVVTNPALRQAAAPSTGAIPATVIYFANNSSTLSREDRAKILQVAQVGSAHNANIRVVGHSSMRTGSSAAAAHDSTNLELSWARANMVADALRQAGVPPDRMVVTAMSDSQPIYVESMPAGEAGNRRVEIYLE